MKKVRIRPGKGQSVLGMAVGIAFCLIGVTVAIPMFGAFGILWTLVAAGITVSNAVNAFSDRGVTSHEIIVDDGGDAPSPEERLETLKRLKNSGDITESEYEEKRKKILDEI